MDNELLSFALELAAVAAAEILPRFQACGMSRKGDGTIVTEADVAAKQAIRRHIRDRYPCHGIIAEEEGVTLGRESRQWVIDPLDGTTCYSYGVPKFGTLIALLEDGRPVIGVIHLPVTCETIYAQIGGGCWYVRNGASPRPVIIERAGLRLADARISLSGVDGCELRDTMAKWHFAGLLAQAGEVEFIGDCVQYTLVARGRFHAALDPIMQPWDSAAVVPCILEAGGVVSTLDGRYDDIVFGGSILASCGRRLHEEILTVINSGANL